MFIFKYWIQINHICIIRYTENRFIRKIFTFIKYINLKFKLKIITYYKYYTLLKLHLCLLKILLLNYIPINHMI